MSTSKWNIPVNIKIIHSPPADSDASVVADMFGLSVRRVEHLYDDFRLTIKAGEIVAVVGPSGGGKTLLLRAAETAVPDAITLEMDTLSADSRASIACFEDGRLSEKFAVLSRCGLADAKALITPAKNLSGGQLYRLALASAVWRASVSGRPRLLLIDEFASTLDTTTASVLSTGLRKLADRYNLAMIVATPRDELLKIIKPDRTIVKGLSEPVIHDFRFANSDFRLEVQDRKDGSRIADYRDLGSRIERGRIGDYRALSRFHYLTGPPAAHKRVWTIRTPAETRRPGLPEVAAVLVISPPVLCCRGRNVATGKRYVSPDRRASTGLLNAEIECISRVVVHPVYRSCGLAVRLVRHALRTAGTPLVEALATMGAIHPFFERGGMSAFGRFKGRKLNYNYYLAAAGAVLPRRLFMSNDITWRT
ncbi:MAG: ATP-binding cassette domain-containing protein [Planctomycetota bacterium]|nr:ATP-binding cassette domain-containing protein [Planctomycetota bacterium]